MLSNADYRIKRIVLGLILIGIGIGYLGEQMQWWNFTLFFPGWWTMILILPSILSMLETGISFPALIILAIGGYFLADANQWITFEVTFPMFMAVIFICIGIRLLFTRKVKWYEYGHKD